MLRQVADPVPGPGRKKVVTLPCNRCRFGQWTRWISHDVEARRELKAPDPWAVKFMRKAIEELSASQWNC
jgi:hypothetical protein